jgi:hypothetical protein
MVTPVLAPRLNEFVAVEVAPENVKLRKADQVIVGDEESAKVVAEPADRVEVCTTTSLPDDPLQLSDPVTV